MINPDILAPGDCVTLGGIKIKAIKENLANLLGTSYVKLTCRYLLRHLRTVLTVVLKARAAGLLPWSLAFGT